MNDRQVTPIPKRRTTRRREPIKNRRMVEYTCAHCGKTFQRRYSSLGSKFCSLQCNGQAKVGKPMRGAEKRLKGETVDCAICGEPFYRKASRPTQKLCSSQCRTESLKLNPRIGFIGSADNSGAKNGRYKHGGRVGAHISKPKVRAAVGERDGNWCLLCGTPPPGLHLHRVRYGSEGGKYEVGNCVQLCGAHHDLVHSDKARFKPILLAYIDGSISSIEVRRRSVS